MTDLQGMSDYLAEHRLGWKRSEELPTAMPADYPCWTVDGKVVAMEYDEWRPHRDIAQCFRYIVPAMIASWRFDLENDNIINSQLPIWRASFDDGASTHYGESTASPSAAIVEAAYKAIKQNRGMK